MSKAFLKILALAFAILLPVVVSAEVVISEIMYNPSGTDGDRDWIELFNNGTDSVTIKGGTSGSDSWRIYQENSTGSVNNRTFGTSAYQGDMTILGGEYVVVAVDGAAFKADYPSYAGKILTVGAMSLTSTASQKVGLKLGSAGTPWSVVIYSSDQGGNDDGESLQLQSGSWVVATPTPGLANLSAASSTNSNNQNNSNATSTTESTNSSTSTTSGGSSGEVTSAHFSSSGLSRRKTEATLLVSAGRDRLGSVGSPLEFRAVTGIEYTRRGIFTWNFGDGMQGAGEALTHTYEYPGEYVVVLNVEFPEGRGVARANVKIVDPQLIVTAASPERIEVKNNSPYEASLYGWALAGGSHVFLFPRDTLIRSGQSVSFSSKTTGLSPSFLHEVQLVMIGETEQPKILEKVEERKQEQIMAIQRRIEVLKAQLATASSRTPEAQSVASVIEEPKEVEKDSLPSVAAVAKSGWLDTVKKFFLRNRELKEAE